MPFHAFLPLQCLRAWTLPCREMQRPMYEAVKEGIFFESNSRVRLRRLEERVKKTYVWDQAFLGIPGISQSRRLRRDSSRAEYSFFAELGRKFRAPFFSASISFLRHVSVVCQGHLFYFISAPCPARTAPLRAKEVTLAAPPGSRFKWTRLGDSDN